MLSVFLRINQVKKKSLNREIKRFWAFFCSRFFPRNKKKPEPLNFGEWGEQWAAELLEKKSYRILERNFRIRGGEIDIIALDGDELVFVEVKSLKKTASYYPEEQVGREKQRKLILTAKIYMQSKGERRSRFDVIAISPSTNSLEGYDRTHIVAAFDAGD